MNHPVRPWALVAGGTGAIGAETSRQLAAAGWNVALTYRSRREVAKEVQRELEALGAETALHQLDLKDDAAAASTVTAVADRSGGGGLKGVVYAAGPHITMNHVSTTTSAGFRDQLEQDGVGCFNLLQPSLFPLRKSSGSIVAIVTPALRRFVARDLMSTVPKAVVQEVVRAIAKEEGRYGIRANAVGVGLIAEGMLGELVARGDMNDKFLETTLEVVPLQRLGSAAEVAAAAVFLLSDKAGYISGQTLHVDGGFSV